MNEHLLESLLSAAMEITRAERALAVNIDLDPVATIKLKDSDLRDARFIEVARAALQKALAHGQPFVTNNIITNPDEAPTTNTNFADLRVVVAIPVDQQGALYLDQHIRYGMISQETILRFMKIVDQVIESGQLDVTSSELVDLYRQSSAV